tara:strand:- start:233 stop:394 length:162 start_codon:yes stop_codon:yes gene_type:complete
MHSQHQLAKNYLQLKMQMQQQKDGHMLDKVQYTELRFATHTTNVDTQEGRLKN